MCILIIKVGQYVSQLRVFVFIYLYKKTKFITYLPVHLKNILKQFISFCRYTPCSFLQNTFPHSFPQFPVRQLTINDILQFIFIYLYSSKLWVRPIIQLRINRELSTIDGINLPLTAFIFSHIDIVSFRSCTWW